MRSIAIILLFACYLACISQAQSACCRASLTMAYTVDGGNCADVGGRSGSKGCTITICADGKPQVGTFCGRGSCNIFGCACRKGCITGDWKNSFISNNSGRIIHVIDMKWNS
ncbi:hypothetical protein KR044_009211 [Drosophila immigrans]|nr:hypothetical protein KR044_009211 [Drosophila immigrans]